MAQHPRVVRIFIGAVLFTIGVASHSGADTIKIPGLTAERAGKRVLLVEIRIKDAQGKDVDIVALVDTGNSDRLSFSKADAEKVGLTKAGEQEGSAAGGKTKFDKTDVPASRQGSFVGEKDSNAGFKASVAGPAFIHEGGLTSIGTEFFNTDPAGPGAVIVNYAKEEVVIYNHEQAKKLGALPFNTGMDAVALGSFNPLTTGHAYTADVGVAYGGNHLESPFVISTGVNATLISEQVASALSIACSIGTFSFTTAAGTFDTPSAVVALDVFPQLGSQSMEVGCLSSALNPDNINVLGTDFLGRFSAVQLNAATGVFSAPEPSLLALGALGVLFIRSRRTRRHRVISEPWADTTDSHRKASSGRAPDAGASG